jgi:hypothetical protein
MKTRQILKNLILEQLIVAVPTSLPMGLIKKEILHLGCKFSDHDLGSVLKELLANGLMIEFTDDLGSGSKSYSLV